MAVLLVRRQARTFSTGLICEAWGGSGRSGDVIGNAQRPCAVPARPVRRQDGVGAFSDGLQDFGEVMAAVFAYGMTGAAVSARSGQTAGAKDAGPFASGIARRPAVRHALCAGATPRFSCRAPHRAGRPVPWRQSFQTPPGPAGRISCGRTERRRDPSAANCLPAVRSCIVTPKRLSVSRCRPTRRQSTTPCVSGPGPARTRAASAAFRAASRSGSRPGARQAPQDLPRCSDGANPVAAGGPSRSLRLPTCGRRSPEPMRPPPYAARPWHHGSGSRQHGVPSTSNPSA